MSAGAWRFKFEQLKSGKELRLIEDYEFSVLLSDKEDYRPTTVAWRVPKGFTWDGASIPWIFRRVAPKIAGPYARAALIHDWLYDKKVCRVNGTYTVLDGETGRAVADLTFYRAMLEDNVGWRAKWMYRFVKLFGKETWDT
jgi:hypothetical protein